MKKTPRAVNWGALDQISYLLFLFPLAFLAFGGFELRSAQNGLGVWILMVACGLVFLFGLWRSARRLQLTRYGAITIGRVARWEETNYERSGRTQYRNIITYLVGETQHHASCFTDRRGRLPIGAEVAVYYDVDKPSRHVMMVG